MSVIAKDNQIGSVMQCSAGLIHVNVPGVSVHFHKDAFLHFASMVNRARREMLDSALNEIMKNDWDSD